MEIDKSTRHQKIIGEFGEHLICNWLSRSGFEVTIVDHTGIDIIAYDPKTNEWVSQLNLELERKEKKRKGGSKYFFISKESE